MVLMFREKKGSFYFFHRYMPVYVCVCVCANAMIFGIFLQNNLGEKENE